MDSTTSSSIPVSFIHKPLKVSYTSRFPAIPPPQTAISGLGSQVNSQKKSFPQWTFNKQDLEVGKAQFLSEKHASRTNLGTTGPGPAYSIPPIHSASQHYNYDYTVGRQPRIKVSMVPAGSTFKHPSMFGKQTRSSFQSEPRQPFSHSTRDDREVVFIANAYLKHDTGKLGPGPHQTGSVSSIGKQASSKKPSCASFKFGTGKRFLKLKCEDTAYGPGPGAYH